MAITIVLMRVGVVARSQPRTDALGDGPRQRQPMGGVPGVNRHLKGRAPGMPAEHKAGGRGEGERGKEGGKSQNCYGAEVVS